MPDPMYRQIAEDLRLKIESGQLTGGSQLPTELELREQHDASRNTVRDAVKLLVTRGLVETRPGQGTFVVQKLDPFVTTLDSAAGVGGEGDAYAAEVSALGRKASDRSLKVEIQRANSVMASVLSVEVGSDIVTRHQQRLIDEVPWSLQTTFYPMRLVEAGATKLILAVDMPSGAIPYLDQALGLKQAGYRDRITVRTPNAAEAAFFKLPDDGSISVFVTFRTGYDESGKPIRLTVTIYPVDRNQFILTSGQVPADDARPDLIDREDPSRPDTAAALGGDG